MTFDHGRVAAATAGLALAASLGLAACNDGSGSAASASTAATAARRASGSVASSASATPTVSQAATASVGPTAVASTSPAPTAKAMAGATRPTATPSASTGVPAACKNLAVQADVKSAVTQTWEHAKRVSHIQPKPGNFYYGSCGTTLYAAARFEAGSGATGDDRVQLQDEGSSLQFFRFTPNTGWWFVGSDAYPATDDCSRFAPVALARQWNCS
ncbi:hypothetical protein [Streptomyces sp. NBC_00203]|uniref:hypothetical protein n=1 Tax=Streptomyces sp. NBC_00203 TaxID=2975680 RepID=UPI0032516865